MRSPRRSREGDTLGNATATPGRAHRLRPHLQPAHSRLASLARRRAGRRLRPGPRPRRGSRPRVRDQHRLHRCRADAGHRAVGLRRHRHARCHPHRPRHAGRQSRATDPLSEAARANPGRGPRHGGANGEGRRPLHGHGDVAAPQARPRHEDGTSIRASSGQSTRSGCSRRRATCAAPAPSTISSRTSQTSPS